MATFGNTSNTNNSAWYDLNYKVATKFTLSEDGTSPKVTAYAKKTSGSGTARLFIQAADGAGGIPGTLMGVTQEVALSNTSLAWVDFAFASGVALTAGQYWIGAHIGDGFEIAANDASGAGYYGTDTYSDGTVAAWTSGDTFTSNFCIYATYTASGGTTVFLPHIFCHHTIPPFIGGH